MLSYCYRYMENSKFYLSVNSAAHLRFAIFWCKPATVTVIVK